MKISSISSSPLYRSNIQRKQTLNFGIAYKDGYCKNKNNDIEKIIDSHIKQIKKDSFLGMHKSKKVNVNDIPSTLKIYRGRDYVLSSEDNQIKAVMRILDDDSLRECDKDIILKDGKKENLFIGLLISKGNGAGKFLINEAIKRSCEEGYDGKLSVYAGSFVEFSDSPIPFYYKLGFRPYVKTKKENLEEAMEIYNKTGVYSGYDGLYMHFDGQKRV